MVADLAGQTVNDKQTGMIAPIGRHLGNGFRWQVVIELRGIHGEDLDEEISAGKKSRPPIIGKSVDR